MRDFLLNYNHYAGWGLVGECLPDDSNTVTLDPDERDQHGLPVARVTFSWGENNKKLIKAGIKRQREIVEAADAEITWDANDTAHLLGACRMGSDPRNSVVDRWCRSWDVPNLFICDGSVFVTSSGVNPSLSIEAIAAGPYCGIYSGSCADQRVSGTNIRIKIGSSSTRQAC